MLEVNGPKVLQDVEGLREFDTRNHNNPEINIEHYKALAWEGLKFKSGGAKTKAYSLMSDEAKIEYDRLLEDILNRCWCTRITCE